MVVLSFASRCRWWYWSRALQKPLISLMTPTSHRLYNKYACLLTANPTTNSYRIQNRDSLTQDSICARRLIYMLLFTVANWELKPWTYMKDSPFLFAKKSISLMASFLSWLRWTLLSALKISKACLAPFRASWPATGPPNLITSPGLFSSFELSFILWVE